MICIIIFAAFSQCKFVDLNKKNGNIFALFWKRAFQFGNKKSKIHLFCPKNELVIFLFA